MHAIPDPMHANPNPSMYTRPRAGSWDDSGSQRVNPLVHGEDDATAQLWLSARTTPAWFLESGKHTISRPRRGTVPFQNRVTPSSVKILYAQWSELRYSVFAWSDCIRVLTTLEGVRGRSCSYRYR